MLTFATIHDPLQLLRACRDLSDLAAFGRGRTNCDEPDEFLGLWLEPARPSALRLASSRTRPVHAGHDGPPLLGSVGVSGLWTLSWLDGDWSRLALLETLVARARTSRFSCASGQFVPVFPSTTSEAAMHDAMALLRRRHPRHVSPPMLQLVEGGTLVLPPSHRWSRGTAEASTA